jgi:hypothetical protein
MPDIDPEIITFTNVQIVEPSFSGKGNHKTPLGTRAFSLVLTEELATELAEKGWNVNRAYVNKFAELSPVLRVTLPHNSKIEHITYNGRQLDLDAQLGFLDHSLLTATVKVLGYPWRINDRRFGIKCYLQAMDASVF